MPHSGLWLKATLQDMPGLGPAAAPAAHSSGGEGARIMLMGFSKPSSLQVQCQCPVTLLEESGSHHTWAGQAAGPEQN